MAVCNQGAIKMKYLFIYLFSNNNNTLSDMILYSRLYYCEAVTSASSSAHLIGLGKNREKTF